MLSWLVAAIGAVLAVVFGLLWARDVTRDVRGDAGDRTETRRVTDGATAEAADEELPVYSRSVFLEASLIGLRRPRRSPDAPVLGFMALPSFTNVDEDEVDLGPLDNFPEGEYVIATYLLEPEQGEVSSRTHLSEQRAEGASRALRSCTAAVSTSAAPSSPTGRSTRGR